MKRSRFPLDDLDQITAPTTEDEQVPGERILLQCLFSLRCSHSGTKRDPLVSDLCQ